MREKPLEQFELKRQLVFFQGGLLQKKPRPSTLQWIIDDVNVATFFKDLSKNLNILGNYAYNLSLVVPKLWTGWQKNKCETSVGTTISQASLEHNKPAVTAAAWPSCSTPPSSWERQLRLVRHPPATLLLVFWKKALKILAMNRTKMKPWKEFLATDWYWLNPLKCATWGNPAFLDLKLCLLSLFCPKLDN